jgi:pyruvate/2-oxoglutarate dehydrogenase complex dihydrolipoamide dehydrogenase (E3) component
MRRLGIDRLTLAHGHARFVGERKVEVDGRIHEAATIVINVGARPVKPSIEGLGAVPALDNHTLMELHELPEHLLVLGGGYIGCEFGQMFRRFGSRVTIADHSPHLLGREDREISSALEEVFRAEGIALEPGAAVSSVAGREGDIRLRLESGKELQGTHLLIAVGRRPNTDDLGCERGGIALDKKGFVVADDQYRTTAGGVYAVGDVLGGPQFTHTSWDDHRLLFDLLLGRSERGRNGRVIPYTVFTDPQVAGVGVTEKEARARGIPFEIASLQFGTVARAIEVDETAGVLKVLIDPATERILGACIVGAEAGELIHVFVALMQANASARAIVDAEFVHPTFSEGVQSLVMALPRFSLH